MSATGTAVVLKGRIGKDRHSVELEGEAGLPAGTEVLVTPASRERFRRGSPEAVLAAMRSGPRISHEEYVELMRAIHETRGDVDWSDPFEGLDLGEDEEGA